MTGSLLECSPDPATLRTKTQSHGPGKYFFKGSERHAIEYSGGRRHDPSCSVGARRVPKRRSDKGTASETAVQGVRVRMLWRDASKGLSSFGSRQCTVGNQKVGLQPASPASVQIWIDGEWGFGSDGPRLGRAGKIKVRRQLRGSENG